MRQTTPALMRLLASSSISYGNKYNVHFQLQNNTGSAKTVKLCFASNAVDVTKTNGTWRLIPKQKSSEVLKIPADTVQVANIFRGLN